MRKITPVIGSLVASAFIILNVSPASAVVPSAEINSGGWSAGLAHDGEYIYNSLLAQSQVIRIDPSDNTIVDTFQLPSGSQPYEMTIVDGFMYTANFWNMANVVGTVSRIDLATGQVTGAWATLSVGFQAEWITSNSSNIFVSGQGGKVARIPLSDPTNITYYTPANGWNTDIVVDGDYLYVAGASNAGGGVIRINWTNGAIEETWAAGGSKILGVAIAGDYIYAGKYIDKTIVKISVSDGSIVATSAAATTGAWLITVGGGVVYGAQLTGGVSTFDASDLTLQGNPYVTVGTKNYDAIPFAGSLWVASYYPNNKVYRFDLARVPSLSPEAQEPANAIVGSAFSTSPFTASNFTSDVTYSISPDLPDGLTLDPETGVISGTPTGTSPVTTYTITAIGTDFVTATITFGVDVAGSGSGESLAATGVNDARTLVVIIAALMLISAGIGSRFRFQRRN
jgi:hypothetical protein